MGYHFLLNLFGCLLAATVCGTVLSERSDTCAAATGCNYTWLDVIEGAVPAQKDAPRALVVYIHSWSDYAQLHPGVDFILLTLESWRRSMGHFPTRKFDLVAVTSFIVAEKLSEHPTAGKVCSTVSHNLNKMERHNEASTADFSQCWILALDTDVVRDWHGFPFVLDLLHFVNPVFERFVGDMGYQLLLKAPCGSLVTPTLSEHWPTQFTIGTEQYVWLPQTAARLEAVAASLGLSRSGAAAVGSVWYGATADVITMARATVELLRHILEHTMDGAAREGLSVTDWLSDADWAELLDVNEQAASTAWNPAMAALYAGDIAVNHCLRAWRRDPQIDVPASRRVSMKSAALVRPQLHDATMDTHLLLRNTGAFCQAWARGERGTPGSIGHFAGLIACQASQTRVPEHEQRYAPGFA